MRRPFLPSALFSVLLLIFLASSAINSIATDVSETAWKTPSSVSFRGNEVAVGIRALPKEPPLLVSLLDGRVVALDFKSGEARWSFESGSPLLSVQQKSPDDLDGTLPEARVFPGIDGGLYTYHGLNRGHPRIERLPVTLPDLVEASPSLTDDGSVVVGKRKSSVFILDADSGKVLRAVTGGRVAETEVDEALRLLDPFIDEEEGTYSDNTGRARKTRQLVILGREDYVVRSMKVDTGAEVWNATFSKIHPMSPLANRLKTSSKGHSATLSPFPPTLPNFIASADNTLLAYDRLTGNRLWSVTFDQPPVGAFSGDGKGFNFLDPSLNPNPPTPSPSVIQPPPSLPPSESQDQGEGKGSRVLVGVIKGSPYALPADHLVLSDKELERALVGGRGKGKGKEKDTCETPIAVLLRPPSALSLPPSSSVSALEPSPDDDSDGNGKGSKGRSTALAPFDDPRAKADLFDFLHGSEPSRASGSGSSSKGTIGSQVMIDLAESQMVDKGRGGQRAAGVVGGLVCLQLSDSNSNSNRSLDDREGGSSGKPLFDSPLPSWLPSIIGNRIEQDEERKKNERPSDDHPQKPGVAWFLHPLFLIPMTLAAAVLLSLIIMRASPLSKLSSKAGQEGLDLSSAEDPSPLPEAFIVKQQPKESTDGLTLPPLDFNALLPPRELMHGEEEEEAKAIAARKAAAYRSASISSRYAKLQQDGSFIIGRLRVGPGVLGYGSAGTVVYEGILDGRYVAVKRLLRQFYDLAKKEIEVLIMSDEHPNVVRCFAMEEDREFVYLALEKCRSTLHDLLSSPQGKSTFIIEGPRSLPTARCIDLIRQMTLGLTALHELGIVHRDIKPHNCLVTEAGRAKLSDMGLCKQLVAEQSSFESHGAGGSSGWQAPEQLLARSGSKSKSIRQTRSMDVFSLGCVIHFCLSGGKHPFGESYERDGNILNKEPDLSPLMPHQPEALNMLQAMLLKDPTDRPSMQAVQSHPLWWSPEKQLQFLVDVSDRVENEDREPDQRLLSVMEARFASVAVGVANWGTLVDPQLVANLGRYRRYQFRSLRDLLRVVRNKRSHFREMPGELQAMLGPLPHGFLNYFKSRFPNLVLAVWVFAWSVLDHVQPEQEQAAASISSSLSSRQVQQSPVEEGACSSLQRQYWPCGAAALAPFAVSFHKSHPSSIDPTSSLSPEQLISGGGGRKKGRAGGLPAVPDPLEEGEEEEEEEEEGMSEETTGPASSIAAITTALGSRGGNGAMDGTQSQESSSPRAPVCVGYEEDPEQANDPGLPPHQFPQRPGAKLCDFYVKLGHCKFGDQCVFDHPSQYSVRLNAVNGLPLRPGQPLCAFYSRTNQCKFGAACRFHHPHLRPLFAGSCISQEDAASDGVSELMPRQ